MGFRHRFFMTATLLLVVHWVVLQPAWCAEESESQPTADTGSQKHVTIQIFSPNAFREKSPDYYDAVAVDALQRQDWASACEAYDEALNKFPRESRLRKNAAAVRDEWARTAVSQQKWDSALAACENALANSFLPDHFQKKAAFIVQEAGCTYVQAGDVMQLEAWLARARNRFPGNPAILRLMTTLYSRALDELPLSDTAFYIQQGVALLQSHQSLRGLQHPDAGMIKNWCSRLLRDLWERKAWEDALNVLRAARELLPNDPYLRQQEIALWNIRAREYIRFKQWEFATLVYEQALERFPEETIFQNNLKYCRQQISGSLTTVQ